MSFDAETRSRLVGLFVAEAEENVAALSRATERLRSEAAPADLSEFGRMAHSLKGAATALGFDDLAKVLHDLEDLSLGLSDAASDLYGAQHALLVRVVELVGQGIAHMSASGRDSFPQSILDSVRRIMPQSDSAKTAPGIDPQQRSIEPTGNGVGPAGEAAAKAAPNTSDSVVERLSVPAEDVDAALRLASALARGAALFQEQVASATGSVLDAESRSGGGTPGLSATQTLAAAQNLATMAEQIETSISSLRLLPAETAFSGFEEEVGQLASRLGKRAKVVLAGLEVRADRRTLQAARSMIRHLVRNAIDHGIETPDARLAAGKPADGRISVRLETAESSLRVTIADDGRGFDLPSIRRDLIRRGSGTEAITSMSDQEVVQLFAFQGGSTRENASEISGRGVGLSAVASMARDAGGTIHILTHGGVGSTITFTLPLEVYAAEVLTFTCGDRLFGLPIQTVERTLHLQACKDAIQAGPTGYTLAVDESILPLYQLAEILGDPASTYAVDRFALVLRTSEGIAVFTVGQVGAVIGVVPITVPGVAHPGGLVVGLAQIAGGGVLEILNARHLVQVARASRLRTLEVLRPSASATRSADLPAGTEPSQPTKANEQIEVMLAEDSLATREVLRVLLEQQGFRVRLASDGEEALARVAERMPDVLVSDVSMPRRDGLSLTRHLRSQPGTARLPIILLTSREDPVTQAAGAAAGADAYLLKSKFNAGVLHETLSRIGVRAHR